MNRYQERIGNERETTKEWDGWEQLIMKAVVIGGPRGLPWSVGRSVGRTDERTDGRLNGRAGVSMMYRIDKSGIHIRKQNLVSRFCC